MLMYLLLYYADHIVISPKVLEELSQVPDSKFPEYLCSLGEMIKHYILLLKYVYCFGLPFILSVKYA